MYVPTIFFVNLLVAAVFLHTVAILGMVIPED